jgi:hypothetical protein
MGRLLALTLATAALEKRGIPVALLRDFEPEGRFVEVDLLIAADRDRELDEALVATGFAPLRAWGHPGHRFYFCYSAPDRMWVKLDLVTWVAGADAQRALSHRHRNGSVPRLDPADERKLLLLHCVLDKRGQLGRHAPALRALGTAATGAPLGAPDELEALWPTLARAVAAPGAGVPDSLVRTTAKAVEPGRRHRLRRNRWLRRAALLRRVVRPVAATVVVAGRPLDDPGHAARQLAAELGPGARAISVPRGRVPVTALRRRAVVAAARRRSDAPLVVDAGSDPARVGRADVTVSAASGPEHTCEAVWPAYRARLLDSR